jgi:hypothetical protein
MAMIEARSDKYRFSARDRTDHQSFNGAAGLPDSLKGLMTRCEMLYERVRRLDENMYEADQPASNEVSSQLARLKTAFGEG